MKQSPSSSTLLGDENVNTNWFSSKGAWSVFGIGIFVARVVLALTGASSAFAWAFIHIVHVIGTFFAFHWMKGSPVDEMSAVPAHGKFDKLTWWEQLDNGAPMTSNKKFLASIILFTYMAAVHAAEYQPLMVLIHTVFLFVGVIPKLPGLYGVRLFGINED